MSAEALVVAALLLFVGSFLLIFYHQYTANYLEMERRYRDAANEAASERNKNRELRRKIDQVTSELDIEKAQRVLGSTNLRQCGIDDLRDIVFPALRRLSVPFVDLASIFANIRRIFGQDQHPRTDFYSTILMAGDVTDYALDDSLQSPTSQASSAPNEFSLFTRDKTIGGPSEIEVHRWTPVNSELEDIVVKQLFVNDRGIFEQWMSEACELRSDVLRLLMYRAASGVYEIDVQSLFTVICAELLRWVPNAPVEIRPVNKVPLEANLNLKSDNGVYYDAVLRGFADVGMFSFQAMNIASAMLVSGEFKRFLRAMKQYKEKDQMLIEMIAVRQADPTRAYVKGFLTDIFALNIAIQDSDGVFYVAPRTCDHREFWIRFLFLLCDISEDQFKSSVLNHVHDIQAPERKKEKGRKASSGSESTIDQAHQESSSQTRRRRESSGGKKESGKKESGKKQVVINFKDWETEEEFDKIFTEQCVQVYRLYGREYLCEDTLRAAGEN